MGAPDPSRLNKDPRPAPPKPGPSPEQQRLMVVALTLLLVALGFVLYRDRDFWFPDTQDAESQPLDNEPATQPTEKRSGKTESPRTVESKKAHSGGRAPKATPPVLTPEPFAADPVDPPTTITRTTLPPLEVEVVAGSQHRTIHPGSNSVRVELQEPTSPTPPPVAVEPALASPETTASVTSDAADRVKMTSETSAIVTHSVQPGYPMLARQMKVQGSVILQALIGRDGLIQDLRVVSGPPILATAAREAVRQWHFKPHFEGSDAVETQAKITVNFTISTN